MAWIEGASVAIDLCGYTLVTIFEREALAEAIERKALAGVRVRIFLGDPSNTEIFKSARADSIELMQRQASFAIGKLRTMHARLASAQRPTINARTLRNGILPFSILRFDDRLSVVHYLWSEYTAQAPIMVIQGSDKPFFRIYMEEYQHYFDESTPI